MVYRDFRLRRIESYINQPLFFIVLTYLTFLGKAYKHFIITTSLVFKVIISYTTKLNEKTEYNILGNILFLISRLKFKFIPL